MSWDQLLIEQKRDFTLAPLLEAAESSSEIGAMSTGYFLWDGVLMHSWTPSNAVVPCSFGQKL